MKKTKKIILRVVGILVGLFFALSLGFYLSTWHPKDIEKMKVFCTDEEPILKQGQKIKILCWNVQFMAGKNYIFFFDEWDGSGPDLRPSSKDISITFDEVARVIRLEDPDIILIQELDSKSKRTDGEDQMSRLLKLLPKEYSAWTTAWYWRAAFVPHPQIMGSVGMQLGIISKYKIKESMRYQLPLMPNNIIVRNLQFKRAVLEAVFPVEGGTNFSAMSIHQDAFAQGSDTMERQVSYVNSLLSQKEAEGGSWVIGGDFNLLAPGIAYSRLSDKEKPYFQEVTEIEKLYSNFNAWPTLEDVNGPDAEKYFSHYPNYGTHLDRTIDYYFTGNRVKVTNYYMRSFDTTKISDHIPFILECVVP